ncbi:hypothetical protein C923_02481 [Plasmodium falciparum UGT5.1]|uniref:Uncharacterized protein n=1 Tax=Plasmodium falciparum UGT5.1 TaxID=1237627 RepID=W7JDA1_PLAFA|nr:hypothetical protein C923_02481 [Plasmodium falciparum UGT5.1]
MVIITSSYKFNTNS